MVIRVETMDNRRYTIGIIPRIPAHPWKGAPGTFIFAFVLLKIIINKNIRIRVAEKNDRRKTQRQKQANETVLKHDGKREREEERVSRAENP